MSYEELKKQVTDKLLSIGFQEEQIELFKEFNDSYVKSNTRERQMIVNGQSYVQEETMIVRMTVIGEGAIDDQPLVGINLSINNQDAGDFWISRLTDLKFFFNIV